MSFILNAWRRLVAFLVADAKNPPWPFDDDEGRKMWEELNGED